MKIIVHLIVAILFCSIYFAYPVTSIVDNRTKFYVVIPSYNNSQWYKKNLDSVLAQDYVDFHIVYVDDCSPDGTGALVQTYIDENSIADKITLIQNKVRKGALANLYIAIHDIPDTAVVVTLDGDDWFFHEQVLSRLAQEYANDQVWLTYGQYTHPWGGKGCSAPISLDVIKNNSYRQGPLVASHLRTFYAWLFKQIKIEDLLHQGKFYPMTWDWAIMFPMLELSNGRFSFIPDILYLYNTDNPINDSKVDAAFQIYLSECIQKKEPYMPLESKPSFTNKKISHDCIDLHEFIQTEQKFSQYLLQKQQEGIDYVIMFNTDSLPEEQTIEDQLQKLEDTQATIGIVIDDQDEKIKNSMIHQVCTPLTESVYTFQSGWMPEIRLKDSIMFIFSTQRLQVEDGQLDALLQKDQFFNLFNVVDEQCAGLLFIK